MVNARLIETSLRRLPAVNKAYAASAVLAQISCSAQRSSSRPLALRQTYFATATDVARQAMFPHTRLRMHDSECSTKVLTAFRRHQSARELHRPVHQSVKRLKTFTTPRAQVQTCVLALYALRCSLHAYLPCIALHLLHIKLDCLTGWISRL